MTSHNATAATPLGVVPAAVLVQALLLILLFYMLWRPRRREDCGMGTACETPVSATYSTLDQVTAERWLIGFSSELTELLKRHAVDERGRCTVCRTAPRLWAPWPSRSVCTVRAGLVQTTVRLEQFVSTVIPDCAPIDCPAAEAPGSAPGMVPARSGIGSAAGLIGALLSPGRMQPFLDAPSFERAHGRSAELCVSTT